MSAAKHTPGPWEAVGCCVRSPFVHGDPDQRGLLIAECAMGSMPATANARLIAAAPEMYAALLSAEPALRVLESLADTTGVSGHLPGLSRVIAAVTAALSKAGEQA